MENKEFFAALTDLVRDKGISEEAFIETLENALASAYKKQFDGGADGKAGHLAKIARSGTRQHVLRVLG